MQNVLITIHLIAVCGMIVLILLQRSEGGALGIGGGGGGGLMSGRSAANALTRTTAVLAAVFFVTSISLTLLAINKNSDNLLRERAQTGAEIDAPLTPPTSGSSGGEHSGGLLDDLEAFGSQPIDAR